MQCTYCGVLCYNSIGITTCERCAELQRYKFECGRLKDLLNEANIRIKHYKKLLGEKTDSEESDE